MITSYADHDFEWMPQLEKTVINSLATSFGLDFLLLQDKAGGDVDTIHNVRNGHYASAREEQRYQQRGQYESTPYHSHKNFIEKGRADKAAHQAGTLNDPYRDRIMSASDKRDLDHVISAKEVHDDPGRVLADINGTEIANRQSNLQSTEATVNRSKGAKSTESYLANLNQSIADHEKKTVSLQRRLDATPRDTPEQQHLARELQAKIDNNNRKIEKLKEIDQESMSKRDAEARTEYEKEINTTYYTSSRFWGSTFKSATSTGLRLGLRQVLGLIASEAWFELRAKLPSAMKGLKRNFTFERFLRRVSAMLKGIWRRVRNRFKDFIHEFIDGSIGGVAASITTTAINIFARTAKNTAKILREMWGSLVKSIKIMWFNPDKLNSIDKKRAALSALTIGAGAVVASLVLVELSPLAATPVIGAPLTSFLAALISGVVTLGLTWSLLHSPLAAKIWDFMSRTAHAGTLAEFVEVNRRLDAYLMELAAIEFNIDPCALLEFSEELGSCSSEMEKSFILADEVDRRGIVLPFKMGDAGSTRSWLSGLAKQ